MDDNKRRNIKIFVSMTLIGAVLDLATKAWAEGALTQLPGQSMMIFEPWCEFALSYNQGTAFSAIFDLGEMVRLILGIASLLVVGLLGWSVTRPEVVQIEVWCYGMLAGGAIGNGYDRVFREAPSGGTGVVDFVKLNYPWGGSWPTFNVADSLLVVGVALLIIRWWTHPPTDDANVRAERS
ncbi:MAG TPA: signal peptidase II [Myxococcales bacterium]|nr:signal peptidase II [Myxococcales bacterium]HAN32403.1 signal peptidase II [Myxococcales bacterium]|tara:strand:- start:2064 stop:2606 length:543 start_codon:yes stop_codon:yes gene_type:complete